MIKKLGIDSSAINYRVYLTVSVAVMVSILVLCAGIWNTELTAKAATKNIKNSLELQQLSNDLHLYQEQMEGAIEFAVTSADAHWRINYENNLTKLQESINTAAKSLHNPIFRQLKDRNNSVIALERQLFDQIAQGNQDMAFGILASDEYQEQKIEQEQQALTVRAALDKEAKDAINLLKIRLNNTTFALVIQGILIIVSWFYIIKVIYKWQNEQKNHSDQLTHLAHYDSLTGIGNRTLFQVNLDKAFFEANQLGHSVGLLLMDIDHFKNINDNLGHDVGDKLLVTVARKLRTICRPCDTVVRLGGDEFAIILNRINGSKETAILGNKILSIFEKPLNVDNHQIKTGTSIGLACYPKDADNSDELLRKADLALYEAKRFGRGNFKYFNAEIEIAARNKIEIEKDLRKAIENNEFELYYQPIIDIATNKPVGTECLIRWFHPEKGMIPPDKFISIAEESRLIVPLGAWILRTACLQQRSWEKQGLPSLNIAVNLSGVQFNEPNLLHLVENIINETNISPGKLTLEITESTLMETKEDVIKRLQELNDLGLKLAIDDFGTGYSSLAYLKRFPIHRLKIDREFVKDIPDDAHDIAIARSIIKMAHELEIGVVAEGVETQEQLQFLKDEQCDYSQGYYHSRPIPAAEFSNWILEQKNSQENQLNIA